MTAEITREYNYCPRCGSALESADLFGKARAVCPNCNWVHFADPKVAVAVLIQDEGKVLLVRRAVDPYRGLWTLPAGFIEAGEDPVIAAERECLEETNLQVYVTSLIDVLYGQEHKRGAHILIAYRGEPYSGDIRPGDDVDQVAYFSQNELPPLAFASTLKILEK